MFRNYLLTTFRQIRKNRLFSFVNVLGLALGMASCLIIAQYVLHHTGFDGQWTNASDIYRIQSRTSKNGVDLGASAHSSPAMGTKLAQVNPEVLTAARFYNIDYQNNSFIYEGRSTRMSFQESGIYGADSDLFEIFDLPIIAGSTERLSAPGTMVLTESTALKYESNPDILIGKQITVAGNVGEKVFEVVGIMADLPERTHLKFNTLISLKTVKEDFGVELDNWGSYSFFTYLKLKSGAPKENVEKEIARIYESDAKAVLEPYGFEITHSLMPVSRLHLHSKAPIDFKPYTDFRLIYALAAIALIILIIAWINYLNLSLVKVLDRLKEVGIRKVLGSGTRQITTLFTLEAVTLNIMSFLLALTLTQLTSPITEQLTGIRFGILENVLIVLVMFLIVIVGSVLIGLYPAIMLRTFNTTNILTGNRKKQKVGALGLRSALVSFQFLITFLLLATTITIYKQIQFMKASDLGMNISDIMVLKAPPGDISQSNRPDQKQFNTFKTALGGRSEILGVTNTGEIPGQSISWGGNIRLSNETAEKSIPASFFSMGTEFFDFFEIEMVAGRKLVSGDGPWTNGAVVINEKMAELLGFDNPEDALEAKLSGFYAPKPIVVKGVVSNHHQTSLHDDFTPIVYIHSSWTEFYFVKFSIDADASYATQISDLKTAVAVVETEWDNSFTDTPIDYYFLDQAFNTQYASDEQFGQIFGAFSSLAILIACLGLYGLTTFTLRQRTKEIGIRKVLGAGSRSLAVLLSQNYFVLIAIAYVLAMPLAWLYLNRWLENYHFRIDLGLWFLIIPLAFVCLVACTTIVSRVLQSVKTNPVDSLKYE